MLSAETITISTESDTITIYHYLDVNRDEKTNINDATYIQKILVELTASPENFDIYGDVNNDGSVDISDVTYIQKYLVKLLAD